MAYKERKLGEQYWNYWEEMVKASISYNTAGIPALNALTSF